MHKLVILIQAIDDAAFEQNWPEFLHQAELMPGLLRESTSRVDQFLFGDLGCIMIHELYFESLEELQAAMSSYPGREAGRLLQAITHGRMSLLLADHKEDDLSHIQQYQETSSPEGRDAHTN